MKTFVLSLFAAVCVVLAGCSLFENTAEVNVDRVRDALTAEREARGKEWQARAEKDAATEDRRGTAAAYAVAAEEASDHIPDTEGTRLPKTAVKTDLKVVTRVLGAPPADKLAEARLANNLILSGKLAEATELLDKVNAKIVEAERRQAAAEALVIKTTADAEQLRRSTDEAIARTKAEAAAASAAKDSELERKIRAKDAEIEQSKANGVVLAQMATSADLRYGAWAVGAGAVLALAVAVILKGNATALTLAGALAGTSGALYTFSVGVMDPSYRVVAIIVTCVTGVMTAGGCAWAIWDARKKRAEAKTQGKSAGAFDSIIPAMAESFKTMDPPAQTALVSAVAISLSDADKQHLVERLTALGYGIPEAWQPTPKISKAS